MPISGAGKGNRPDLPEGLFDSPNKRVQPTSLYLQQLQDRLGPTARQSHRLLTTEPPPKPITPNTAVISTEASRLCLCDA